MHQQVPNVLLVDDREDGLVNLEAVLKVLKLNIFKARSGAEALEYLAEHEFSLILLDVQMPVIDGFETARRIKLLDLNRFTPIIFVSAINKDDEFVYRGYEYGAVDYVFKPFDDYVLRSKVSVFVDLHFKNQLLERQSELIKSTERRERFMRLKELEIESLKRYQGLADSIPHAIWRAKTDGTMDYFNRGWTRYTGLTAEQSLGIGWQSAFNAEDLRLFLIAWMEAMESGKDFEQECRIVNQDQEMRWHVLRVVPERRANGELLAWLGTSTDIHERKCAERKLIEARLEADSANLAKTHFLANMSHEIRTPLNGIIGFTELVANRNNFDADTGRHLMTIRRNGTQLLKIIDEILDISKIESGNMELEWVDVDLRVLYTELHSLFHLQATERELSISFHCLTPVPSHVLTDPTRYRQILVNIIGNAIKFTREGSIGVQVSWLPDGDGKQGTVRCRVKDSGIGIDKSRVDRLFNPFSQVDSSISRQFGGTGLGLALSQRFSKSLGGDVYLESSEQSEGSTFVVEIYAQVGLAATLVTSLDSMMPHERGRDSAQLNRPLGGVDVLVVDDANDNRVLISHFLTLAGAHVDCASDGRDGVDKALNHGYDLVLMDIQMPILDGYQATSLLREGGFKKPIIALTAHAFSEDRARSLRAGCNGHITKPVDRKILIDQIARFVGAAAP